MGEGRFKHAQMMRKNVKKVVPGDATPPTMSKESVLITATINTHEGRYIGICNIPGDFLNTDMDKDIRIALRGRLAELMANIELQIYIHHMIYLKVRTVPYVTLKKAPCGCLRFLLLVYEQLVENMRGKRFEINPLQPMLGK